MSKSIKKHGRELKRKRRRKELRLAKLRRKQEEGKPKISDKKGVAHSQQVIRGAGATPSIPKFDRSAWGLEQEHGKEEKTT